MQDESQHFTLIVIVSFQIQSVGIQSQSNNFFQETWLHVTKFHFCRTSLQGTGNYVQLSCIKLELFCN